MTPPLIAYYGDDFTGSADVMEVLQWNGLRTVLFLDAPSPGQLKAFEGLTAFGVAGTSRSMSNEEMDVQLRNAFECLKRSNAAIVHYKTCSTFDSSPLVGSIGKALEVGREVFGTAIVPIVIGAPNLGRYQVFGNLFARSGLDTEPFRLDRHPTMVRHPITPMNESDLRVHLAEQTSLRIGLCDVFSLDTDNTLQDADVDAILFDVLYPEQLARIGAHVQRIVDQPQNGFVVGSSGIEYALAEYWKQQGRLESMGSRSPGSPKFSSVDRLVVLTGSCSPVNGRQIGWAEQHGFETLALEPAKLIQPDRCSDEVERAVESAWKVLRQGKNLVLHTSRGPDDPRIAATLSVLREMGCSDLEIRLKSGQILGPALGRILQGVLEEQSVKRVGVAGGDTSGYIARELGITALEAIAPVAPGSPLCRAYAENEMDGIEFCFKGGQVGKDDVWGTMLAGTAL